MGSGGKTAVSEQHRACSGQARRLSRQMDRRHSCCSDASCASSTIHCCHGKNVVDWRRCESMNARISEVLNIVPHFLGLLGLVATSHIQNHIATTWHQHLRSRLHGIQKLTPNEEMESKTTTKSTEARKYQNKRKYFLKYMYQR